MAAIIIQGTIAPMVLDGPMDAAAFESYVRALLIPALPPQAIGVMDNLSAHKSPRLEQLLNQVGAALRYLPPYSPDLNPAEPMYAKVKTALRSAKARCQATLHQAIASALAGITSSDAKGFLRHCFVSINS